MEETKKKRNIVTKIGIVNITKKTIDMHGAAIKEHLVAYSGIDNESGRILVKGLKDISKSKVNPEYAYQNILQQAGFSAEVKEVARVNAGNILSGSQNRKIRTDDLGSVNDQLFDHMEMNSNGDIIKGSGSQMKFIGASEKDLARVNDAKRAVEKLKSRKYDKYFDNDVVVEVPSDYYDDMLNEISIQMEELRQEELHLVDAGDLNAFYEVSKKRSRLEHIKDSLRKSEVSSSEAVFARLHPKLSTMVDATKIAHGAGVSSAKKSLKFACGTSIINNTVQLAKGDIEADEAVISVAKDTGAAAIRGYEVGFAGSAVKGFMQNSSSEYIRTLSTTNLPGTLVVIALDAGKTMKRFYDGEIDGVECLEELGQQGTNMLGASLFATIGQLAIPIPIVGGIIGGMLGYALTSASYSTLKESLQGAKIAREERIVIEAACEEHIELLKQYQAELTELITVYLSENISLFNEALSELSTSLHMEDVDGFILGTNKISNALGRESQFNNFNEFNQIMKGTEPFKL